MMHAALLAGRGKLTPRTTRPERLPVPPAGGSRTAGDTTPALPRFTTWVLPEPGTFGLAGGTSVPTGVVTVGITVPTTGARGAVTGVSVSTIRTIGVAPTTGVTTGITSR